MDTDFQKRINHIKGHHFAIGNDPKYTGHKHYESVATRGFDYKGKASDHKNELNSEKLQDLRTCHFQLGQQPQSFVTQNQSNFKAHGNVASELAYEKLHSLRASHFSIGKDKNTYATEAQGNYKWIQPTQQ